MITNNCTIIFFSFLLVLFINPTTIIAQKQSETARIKWSKIKEHLDSNRMEAVLHSAKEMEKTIEDKQSVPYGKVAYLKGEYWYSQKEWRKSFNYINTAINLLQGDSTEQLTLSESYVTGAYCLHDLEEYEQAFLYYQNALNIKKKIHGKNHIKVCNIYFNMGYIQQERRNLIKSDKLFLEGLTMLQTLYKKENKQFADFYEELGYNQNLKGDFNAAIKYLDKAVAIKIKEYGSDHQEMIYAYNYLGKFYRDLENYEKAVDYFNKTLLIVEKQSTRNALEEAMLYFNIGECLYRLKRYSHAFRYFEKAINTDKGNQYIISESYRLKGEIELKKGSFEEARVNFEKALNSAQKKSNTDFKNLINIYLSLIQYAILANNYKEAFLFLDKALTLGQSKFKDTPSDFFDLYKKKGTCYFHLGDFEKALLFYSKANEVIGGDIDRIDANLGQLKDKVSLNLEYVNLYLKKINSNNSLEWLLKTDTLLLKTINLVNYITQTYQERSTKENFIEQYYSVFRKAVHVKYLIYNKTKNKQYLVDAFALSEKSKNLILLESLKNVSAFELSGIPSSILDKAGELKTNITYLENRRFEENQRKAENKELIDQLNSDIFKFKQKHESLLKQIQQDYPKYYQLKFKSTSVSVKEIQQNILNEEQSFVEYFIGDSIVYVFLIKKEEFHVFPLPKNNDLDQKITQFRKSIYTYRPSFVTNAAANNDSLIAISANLGFELYEQLIAPFQQELTKRVTIITDGVLGYLPFDALLQRLPKNNTDFRTHSYLMNSHLISYAHSGNWLNGLLAESKIEFDENFIGIAPTFKGSTGSDNISDFRSGLGPLKYNKEEVKNIQKNIGGQIIIGLNATRKSFLENIKNAQVLHLATHGKSNDNQGDYSYLAFAEPKNSTHNQLLYVRDLFNLKIPAELVVLSACETGLGEVKRGEGIVGIGKGFSYAGAKSLVTTLWRVNDNSTAKFMPLFYENLKVGMRKDEALWEVKKQFIKNNRNACHPFFWSGYVAYGNMQPIEFQHNKDSFFFQFGISIILLSFLFLFFKRSF